MADPAAVSMIMPSAAAAIRAVAAVVRAGGALAAGERVRRRAARMMRTAGQLAAWTGTGTLELWTDPSPSWPVAPLPQQSTWLVDSRVQKLS